MSNTKHHVSFLIVLLLVSSVSFADDAVPKKSGPQEIQQVANEEAFRLYHQIRKDIGDENLCFSPSSLSLLMGAVYLGTAGETQTEIGKVFGYSGPVDAIKAISRINGFKNNTDTGKDTGTEKSVHPLQIATNLWLHKQLDINPLYADIVRNLLGAGVEKVDFSNDLNAASEKINEWISQKTEGAIDRVFEEGDLTALTRFVAVNAILFQGKWEQAFDKNVTRRATFHSPKESHVQMMGNEDHYQYRQGDAFASLELPYKNSDLVMVVFLPEKNVAFTEFENSFSGAQLNQHFRSAIKTHVDLQLPQFATESKMDFIPALKNMGVCQSFLEADFSRLLEKNNDNPSLHIDAIRQRCKITVDEEGTVAAAVSGAAVGARSAPRITHFHVDRPFIYVILDKSSNVVHFIGRFIQGKSDDGTEKNSEGPSAIESEIDESMLFSVVVESSSENGENDAPPSESLQASTWDELRAEKRTLNVLVMHTALSAENIVELASINSLKSVAFYGVKLPREGLSALQNSAGINSLTIANTAINDKICEQISEMKTLHTLDLYYHTDLSDKNIEKILSNANIKEITLFDCTGITDKALLQLSKKHPQCLISVRGLGVEKPYNLLNGEKELQ